MRRWLLSLSALALLPAAGRCQPAPAADADPTLNLAWQVRAGSSLPALPAASAVPEGWSRCFLAYCLSEKPTGRTLAAELITPQLSWLEDFGRMEEVHGDRQPAWLHSDPEVAALTLLTLVQLDRAQPSATRRDQIGKFANGLALTDKPDFQKYPFGVHTLFSPGRKDNPGYAPVAEGAAAPGAVVRPDCSYMVKALAVAAQYLGDRTLLDEAETEALGLWTHLAMSDLWVWGFTPRPTGHSDILGPAAAVDNFAAVGSGGGQTLFALLSQLAAAHALAAKPGSPAESAAQAWLKGRVEPSAWKNAAEPISYKVMEAEDGKAVQKAFDVITSTYPDGTPAKLVKVGRDQMFWMRFDVDREDSYFFYLTFLKSQLEGALVSVLMRIDGDKIFQVNLGGASDAYVDMDFVDGPRTLRSGPHSFGIRFSGLLMTQPAMLDSVLAWPVIERRSLQRSDGKRGLLLHNMSTSAARTTFTELPSWPPERADAWDRHGAPAQLTRESDKRRRKEYVVLPPGGTAWLEWTDRGGKHTASSH